MKKSEGVNRHWKYFLGEDPTEAEAGGLLRPAQGEVLPLAPGIGAQQMQRAAAVLAPLAAENPAPDQKEARLQLLRRMPAVNIQQLSFWEPGLHTVVFKPQAEIRLRGHVPAPRQQGVIVHHALTSDIA